MADDEKTLAPSQHKISKAREEGNVSKSVELVGFFVMLCGLALIFFMIPFWVSGCENVFRHIASFFVVEEFDKQELLKLFLELLLEVFKMVAPVFIGLMIIGVVANVGQFGLLLAPKAVRPKLSKINPVTGIKNVFSLKKLLDGFMITLKVSIAFIVGFVVFISFFGELPTISRLSLYQQVLWFREKALILIGILLILFFAMAVADFMIKRYQYIKSLRMSVKELKDETKLHEGNPEIKARVRQMQQKIARSNMMREVPNASVVITNPTHYAVAVRYSDEELDKGTPPLIVAKGIDELAIRIKAIAREHNVRIIENPPLARQLYALAEVGTYIPEDLFIAVSKVLQQVAHLDSLQGKETLAKTLRKIDTRARTANR
ncbi:flagellar biosynthesis protein FlhB [Helicobacter sp. MIT 00-7814]|uniref:flagellar biosynthesis protein FlhB n=1 Tax=unclassified Helicobacter TaxID=2593540 RepID=UPI000E1E971A|nr:MULTISPECIES: flagellar biosynthesis protein FlhB [unclassified Helicobacter]RDU54803.1 flagellar biosynthesis protein FlhB [Helicobacter sp. MIT 99-10781]RDU54861.1 flagellar biosynthesis protein FlhB [Helicobacter sp. MIT 00-7814]